MAWLRWHTSDEGVTTALLLWRDPLTRMKTSRSLGAVDEVTAEIERRAATIGIEGRTLPAKWLPASDLFAQLLGYLKAKGDRPATLEMYHQVLDPLLAAWRATPLKRWSRPMLEVYVAQHPGWAPRTTQMLVNACRHLIRWARDCELGCPDFVGRFRGPKVIRTEPVIWTPDQVAAILAKSREVTPAKGKGRAPHVWRYVVPVHLAALAGLSLGDLRTLTWGEVDLTTGWITRREGRRKTGAPLRVKIAPALAAVLKDRRGTAAALVCPEMPDNRSGAQHALRRLCEAAGVPLGGWHRFRHSLASDMGAHGASVADITRALAHRHGSTVALRYVHSGDAQLATSMEAAAARLTGAAGM